MDVFSTVAAAGGVVVTIAKGISQLHDFITGVKDVDETVRNFYNEVLTLQTVSEAIKNSFQDIPPEYFQGQSIQQIWTSMDQILSDCQYTVSKLDRCFRKLGRQHGNAYRAVATQLRINSKSSNIANLRRQIQFYNEMFQTCLLSVNMWVVRASHYSNRFSRSQIVHHI